MAIVQLTLEEIRAQQAISEYANSQRRLKRLEKFLSESPNFMTVTDLWALVKDMIE